MNALLLSTLLTLATGHASRGAHDSRTPITVAAQDAVLDMEHQNTVVWHEEQLVITDGPAVVTNTTESQTTLPNTRIRVRDAFTQDALRAVEDARF